jgi:hypothetical protein
LVRNQALGLCPKKDRKGSPEVVVVYVNIFHKTAVSIFKAERTLHQQGQSIQLLKTLTSQKLRKKYCLILHNEEVHSLRSSSNVHDQIEEDEVGRACSEHETGVNME